MPPAKNFESFIVKGGDVIEKVVGFWVVFDDAKLENLKEVFSFEFLLDIISKDKTLASIKWEFNIDTSLGKAMKKTYAVYFTNENASIENILRRR